VSGDRPTTLPPSRRALRRWLEGPVALIVLPLVVAYPVTRALLDLVTREDPLRAERLVPHAIIAVLGGVVLAVVIQRIRSRPGTGPSGLDVGDAVADGRLPPGADVEAWTGILLRRRAAIAAETKPTQLVLGVAVVVAGVAWAVMGGPLVAGLVAGAVAVVMGVVVVVTPRRLARVDAVLQPLLIAEAEARPFDAAPDPGPDARTRYAGS
jgi:hypothetical protein